MAIESQTAAMPFNRIVELVCRLSTSQWVELCRRRDENCRTAVRPDHSANAPGEEDVDEWLDELEAMLADEGCDVSTVPSLDEVRTGLSGIKGNMAEAVREERDLRG